VFQDTQRIFRRVGVIFYRHPEDSKSAFARDQVLESFNCSTGHVLISRLPSVSLYRTLLWLLPCVPLRLRSRHRSSTLWAVHRSPPLRRMSFLLNSSAISLQLSLPGARIRDCASVKGVVRFSFGTSGEQILHHRRSPRSSRHTRECLIIEILRDRSERFALGV